MSRKVVTVIAGGGLYLDLFSSKYKIYNGIVDETELVVFTGGTDISTKLYGEEPLSSTMPPDWIRDDYEVNVFKECVDRGIPMVGICRGAQLLCVMNGGKLIQHVNNHSYSTGHEVITNDDRHMQVTSSHHQMMVPEGSYELLAAAFGVGAGHSTNSLDMVADGRYIEPEVVYWPETKSLGHQPHPEWMKEGAEYLDYFWETVDKYLGV